MSLFLSSLRAISSTLRLTPLAKSQVPPSKASEQGLTLLECLMAIVVIGLTVTMITPPLVISAATRVQNRRTEQAMQIAQGEVDRIRALVAKDEHTAARLPAIVPDGNLQAVAAPAVPANPATPSTGSPIRSPRNCGTPGTYNNGEQMAANQGLRIDVDGDCKADFFMQTFRTQGTMNNAEVIRPTRDQRPSAFQMGVRVYSILADGSSGSLETAPASLNITSSQGKQRTRPLAVLYTPFSRSDQGDALCFYQPGERAGNLRGSCN
jgi:prepilin-type N-terminal cleavage/methylation domain-containing protein